MQKHLILNNNLNFTKMLDIFYLFYLFIFFYSIFLDRKLYIIIKCNFLTGEHQYELMDFVAAKFYEESGVFKLLVI